MLDVALLSGFIIIVVAVNRWLKTEVADKQNHVNDSRGSNEPLMMIPLVLLLAVSCNEGANNASAQEVPEYEPYITQAEIDTLTDVASDSTGKCFSAGAYDGMKLFMKNCNVCHPAGEKGKGPSLVDMKYLPDWLIHFQVRTGRGDMPSFTKEQISNDQVKRIVLFIRSLREDKTQTATEEKKK